MRKIHPVAMFAVALLVASSMSVFAQSASPAPQPSFDFGPIVQALLPAITDVVITIIGIVAMYLATQLKAKWGIDMESQLRNIEAKHRDALHSAIETALGSAVAKYGPNLQFTPNSAVETFLLNAVKKSVPEAVTFLGTTDNWLLQAAESKFTMASVSVTAPPQTPLPMAATTKG